MEVLRGAKASPTDDARATRQLIDRVRARDEPGIRVWVPPQQVAFGRRDRQATGYDRARTAAANRGYPPTERATGGRAVAFHDGVLAVVRAEPADPTDPAVAARYERLLDHLETALANLGVAVRRGEPPAAFCPGTHSLRSEGKVAGVAQRVQREVALVAAVVIVADPDRVATVLAPVYDALDVEFDPESVGSVATAGGPADPDIVRKAVESTLIGDAEPTVRDT
ncbi:MAG: lipoate--protein ligase family protein [Salinirussus sp.]